MLILRATLRMDANRVSEHRGPRDGGEAARGTRRGQYISIEMTRTRAQIISVARKTKRRDKFVRNIDTLLNVYNT